MKKLILLRKKPLPILFISLCLIVILMPIIPSTSVYSSSDTLNITLVGDLFLGNWIEEYIQKDPSYPFLHITSILGQSDLLIGNLEAPLSLKGEVYVEKTYTLHCHPQAVKSQPPVDSTPLPWPIITLWILGHPLSWKQSLF